MPNLDKKFTKQVEEWLNTPFAERDVPAGALMLLQMNRNQALYTTIMRRPDKFHEKLEYEMRKLYKMRLADVAMEDVAKIAKKVIPQVKETVEEKAIISTDDEMPTSGKVLGKRADHDQLPDYIKEMWERNGQTYRRIRLLYNECLAMTEANARPCDLYEKLQLLSEADIRYRETLRAYDSYVIGVESKEEIDAQIAENRKKLSHYKTAFKRSKKESVRAHAVEELQRAVDFLLTHNVMLSDDERQSLREFGVTFNF